MLRIETIDLQVQVWLDRSPMFLKLASFALDHSLTTLSKLIAPENSALILKRAQKRIAFTRLDRLLLGWFTEHLPGWEEVLVTAKPATITFIRNHLNATVAMDFFAVKTAKKGEQLYVWFMIHHGIREILHWNVTAHPSSAWVSHPSLLRSGPQGRNGGDLFLSQ